MAFFANAEPCASATAAGAFCGLGAAIPHPAPSCIARSARRPRMRPTQASSQGSTNPACEEPCVEQRRQFRMAELEHLVRGMFCAPGRNRTYDRQIRNRP
jgi:hypothetical protein